jgi:oligopeptide transport system substrate-binding protein
MRRISILVPAILLVSVFSVAQESDSFSVNFLVSDINLNPLISYTTTEAQFFTAIYEGLVTYDPYSLDPLPAIARRWDISEDGRTYRFYIRQDAHYSNGDPIMASDFRDTWLTLLAPETDAPYASLLDIVSGARDFRTGANPDPESVGIRIANDRTLEVELEFRATHFMRILCHHSFVVVHPDMLGRETWNEEDPFITSGPYVIESFGPEEILLSRNERYWDNAGVDIDELRLTFSDDSDSIVESFNNGEIDWVRGGVDLSEVELQDTIVVNPLFSTNYFQFSARTEPFSDGRVRRALALLLPWDEIRSEELQYLPTANLVPSIPFYPEVEGITAADSEEAFALLEDAGFPRGEGLPDFAITIPDGEVNALIAQTMADAWNEHLGLNCTLTVVPFRQYFSLLDSGDFVLSTMGWIGDFADPLTFLDMWTGVSNLNNSAYVNPEFDALIQLAMGQTGDERYVTLAEAEELLLHDAIVLPFSHSPSINLINLALVDGWFPNPLDVHPFKYLSFSSGRPHPNVALQ